MVHPYDFVIVGLTLDVFGGIVLAKGFMRKGIKDIVRESATMFGGNGALLTSALLQRSEAWIGGTFLAGGFGLQLWGTFHGVPTANELGYINSGPRLLVLIMGIAFLTYGLLKLGHTFALRERSLHFSGRDPWNV